MIDPLIADRISVDNLDAAMELYFERGWTDGLPITPPLIGKVEAFLATVPRDADDIVGIIPPRMRPATVEKIAV
ncbi:MAG: thioredoxin, partial [Chloroflexi bacterium]|nr:thioredoxin [Chloroflexota bacterium]